MGNAVQNLALRLSQYALASLAAVGLASAALSATTPIVTVDGTALTVVNTSTNAGNFSWTTANSTTPTSATLCIPPRANLPIGTLIKLSCFTFISTGGSTFNAPAKKLSITIGGTDYEASQSASGSNLVYSFSSGSEPTLAVNTNYSITFTLPDNMTGLRYAAALHGSGSDGFFKVGSNGDYAPWIQIAGRIMGVPSNLYFTSINAETWWSDLLFTKCGQPANWNSGSDVQVTVTGSPLLRSDNSIGVLYLIGSGDSDVLNCNSVSGTTITKAILAIPLCVKAGNFNIGGFTTSDRGQLIFDATDGGYTINNDTTMSTIRTSTDQITFKGSGSNGVTLNYGTGMSAGLSSHLIFDGGTHAFSYGMGSQDVAFSTTGTLNNPTLLVKDGTTLNYTLKDQSGCNGSRMDGTFVRAASGSTLNILPSGNSSMFMNGRMVLEPGSTTTYKTGTDSNGFCIYGGANTAKPQLYVPSPTSGAANAVATLTKHADSSENIKFGKASGTGGAAITVDRGATLRVNSPVEGDQAVMKGGAGMLELMQAATLSGTVTVEAGTVVTRANTTLSNSSNVLMSGATLEVAAGKLTYTCGSQGIKGHLIIDEGATFEQTSGSDALGYDQSGVVVDVYGTLSLPAHRWTIKTANTINVYPGGEISGAGEGSYGALEASSQTTVHAKKNNGEGGTATISARLRPRLSAGAFVFDVEDGMTLKLTGTNGDCYNGFIKSGAGVLEVTSDSTYSLTGAISVNAGTLRLAKVPTTGTITVASGATLEPARGLALPALAGSGTIHVTLTDEEIEDEDPVTVFSCASVGNMLKVCVTDSQNRQYNVTVTDNNYTVDLAAPIDVAQIGEVKYKTLTAAFAAVQVGEKVTLLADANEPLVAPALAFTLAFDGHSLEGSLALADDSIIALIYGTDGALSAPVTGRGTIVCDGCLPDSKLQTSLQAAAWTGTVWLKNKDINGSFGFNNYCNSDSKIKVTGITGYGESNGTLMAEELILEDDNTTVALTISNGWSGKYYKISKMSGTGTFKAATETTQDYVIADGSGFSGSIDLETIDGVVVIFGDAGSATGAKGLIRVASGKTVTIASGKTWQAHCGIQVDGTLNNNGTLTNAMNGTGTIDMSVRTDYPTESSKPSSLAGWTGNVIFPATAADVGNLGMLIHAWGGTGSTVQLNDVGTDGSKDQGCGTYLGQFTVLPKIILTGTVYLNSGASDKVGTFKELSGSGVLNSVWSGTETYKINVLTNFTGLLNHAGNTTTGNITIDKLALTEAPAVNDKLVGSTTSAKLMLTKITAGGVDITSSVYQENRTDGIYTSLSDADTKAKIDENRYASIKDAIDVVEAVDSGKTLADITIIEGAEIPNDYKIQNGVLIKISAQMAKIADLYYATLSEAIKAVTADQTVFLLNDCTENVTTAKTFVLDLNQHELSGTVNVGAGGVVTIEGVNKSGFTRSGTGTLVFNIGTTRKFPAVVQDITVSGGAVVYKIAETPAEYGYGLINVTGLPAGATLIVARADGTTMNLIATAEGTVTYEHDPIVSGASTLFDYTFTNTDLVATGSRNTSYALQYDAKNGCQAWYSADGNAMLLKSSPWIQMNEVVFNLNRFSIAMAGKVSATNNAIFVAFGSASLLNGVPGMLFLATSADGTKVDVCYTKGSVTADGTTRLAQITVPNMTTAQHMYVLSKTGDRELKIYLDGALCATVPTDFDLKMGCSKHSGVQFGSGFGYCPASHVRVPATDTTADVSALRIFDYVISDAQLQALTGEFPYDAPNAYNREIATATVDWVSTGAWTIGDKTADQPLATGSAKVTAKAETTISVNLGTADAVNYEKVAFTGTHPITLALAAGNTVPVRMRQAEIDADVTARPAAADFADAVVTFGRRGKLTVDLSELDCSRFYAETTVDITGACTDGALVGAGRIAIVKPANMYGRDMAIVHRPNGRYGVSISLADGVGAMYWRPDETVLDRATPLADAAGAADYVWWQAMPITVGRDNAAALASIADVCANATFVVREGVSFDIGTVRNARIGGGGRVKAQLAGDYAPGDAVAVFAAAGGAPGIGQLRDREGATIDASFYTVADGTVTFKREATAGARSYFTLKQAIEAQADGATIELVADVTNDEAIAVARAIVLEGGTNVLSGARFSFDGGTLVLGSGCIGIGYAEGMSLAGGLCRFDSESVASWDVAGVRPAGYEIAALSAPVREGYGYAFVKPGFVPAGGERLWAVVDERGGDAGAIKLRDDWVERVTGVSDAQGQSVALNAREGNGFMRWQNAVLGLDGARAGARPVVAPVQGVSTDKIAFMLGGCNVDADSGAAVTYRVLSADSPGAATWTEASGETAHDGTALVDLPASGARYYKLAVDVQTSK